MKSRLLNGGCMHSFRISNIELFIRLDMVKVSGSEDTRFKSVLAHYWVIKVIKAYYSVTSKMMYFKWVSNNTLMSPANLLGSKDRCMDAVYRHSRLEWFSRGVSRMSCCIEENLQCWLNTSSVDTSPTGPKWLQGEFIQHCRCSVNAGDFCCVYRNSLQLSCLISKHTPGFFDIRVVTKR